MATKYLKKYCERVVALGRMGYHHEEMAADLGISRKTLHNWRVERPEFAEAMDLADTFSQAWWASIPRREAMGEIEEVNSTKWVFTMKNKAGWTDKVEQKVETDAMLDVNVHSLVEQLQALGIDPSKL